MRRLGAQRDDAERKHCQLGVNRPGYAGGSTHHECRDQVESAKASALATIDESAILLRASTELLARSNTAQSSERAIAENAGSLREIASRRMLRSSGVYRDQMPGGTRLKNPRTAPYARARDIAIRVARGSHVTSGTAPPLRRWQRPRAKAGCAASDSQRGEFGILKSLGGFGPRELLDESEAFKLPRLNYVERRAGLAQLGENLVQRLKLLSQVVHLRGEVGPPKDRVRTQACRRTQTHRDANWPVAGSYVRIMFERIRIVGLSVDREESFAKPCVLPSYERWWEDGALVQKDFDLTAPLSFGSQVDSRA